MRREGLEFDKKSLKKVTGKTADFKDLAKDCVAFANAKGGELHIGIEDNEELPPRDQKIQEEINARITTRIRELTINVAVSSTIEKANNGSEFIVLRVLPSASSVACTTTGIYYIRDNDKSRAVLPDELQRLMGDKNAYCWETKVSQKVSWNACDSQKISQFIEDINGSDRVSKFVKDKTPYELLTYYDMVDSQGFLTNLGILWIGTREQRSRLLYSPNIQYIKYDSTDSKINKIVWDDYSLNPKELLEAVWSSIPDWKEINEVSVGLWRKNVPAYDEKVVREALCNALVHRPYTTRGDIFIDIYPDRMEVVNPGQFPIGVTTSNILQTSIQRNVHLAKIFCDLHLMEKEGSGYDLMYETLLSAGKDIPIPYEENDRIRVVIKREIINKDASRLCDYVKSMYKVSQKGLIALGLILQSKTITAIELSNKLQLHNDDRLRSYTEALLEIGIIAKRGKGKGTKYFVSPQLIAASNSNIPTTLKTIEPYCLKALIKEDLKFHPDSGISSIRERLSGADIKELQKTTIEMAKNGEIVAIGGRKYRKYRLP